MLTEPAIRQAPSRERDSKLFDGGGLFLLVRPNSQRGWRFNYRVHGREKLLSLGPYPAVSLAKARKKRDAAKKLLQDGIDPSVQRQAEKIAGANSFEAVAREWLGTHSTRWTASYSEKIVRRLERDIFPWIGRKPIKEIWPPDLLACLKRIEARGAHETAHRVYQNIGWIFRYATSTRRCDRDPAASLQGSLLPTNERHLACITDPKQFGELLRAIDAYTGSHTVRTALRLAPLVIVTDGANRSASYQASVTVTKPAPPAITITSGRSQSVTTGAALSPVAFTLTGTGPLTISVMSNNVSAATLSSGCGTTSMSCTVTLGNASTTAGTGTLTMSVEDSYAQSVSGTATISETAPAKSGGGSIDWLMLLGLSGILACSSKNHKNNCDWRGIPCECLD